jgi:hypothetical protein
VGPGNVLGFVKRATASTVIKTAGVPSSGSRNLTGNPALVKDVNSLHKPPAFFGFRSMSRDHPVPIKPFHFSLSEQEAYDGS